VALDLSVIAFAVSLGVGTFFSPCAVALVPAYVGYYTGTGSEEAERTRLQAAISGARFGSAAALGVLGIFAIGSIAIHLLRTRLGVVDSAQLLDTFSGAGIAVGALLVLLGGLLIASRAPTLDLPLSAPKQRTLPAMAGFGIVFAVASMGCTLPLFFGLIGAALAQPAPVALAMMLAFGAAIAGLLLAVSVGVSVAEDAVKSRIRAATRYAKPASGVLLVLAGLYTINFYLKLVPLPF